MKKIASNVTELIGNTPLVELNKYGKAHCVNAHIIAKCEQKNPGGSAKDRIAMNIISNAEKEGKLKKGGMIIEATSGNTGVGIALVSAVMDYKAVIVMPENMSIERQKLIKAYGAEIILTDSSKGMKGAIEKAEELHRNNKGSIIANQFANPFNPEAHYLTTGPEIWRDTDGDLDAFIAGVGSGGTLSGTARYLKEKNPNIKIFAMEPDNSAVLSGESSGKHKIQGIGAGFIPKNMDMDIIDEIIRITDEEAYNSTFELAKTEGLFVGISSGAVAYAATKVASKPEFKGKKVVVILPDTGERYLSVL